jgi:hypothetical protein
MHFPFSPLQHGRPIYALWMPLMLGIIFLGGTNKGREKFGLFCVLLVLLFFQIACGGGSSNSSHTPPPTNYTVTVTATSGATQHATTVAVTVQ